MIWELGIFGSDLLQQHSDVHEFEIIMETIYVRELRQKYPFYAFMSFHVAVKSRKYLKEY